MDGLGSGSNQLLKMPTKLFGLLIVWGQLVLASYFVWIASGKLEWGLACAWALGSIWSMIYMNEK